MKKDRWEVRVDHARVQVSESQLKAIRMKAKADGTAIEEFCNALAGETRRFYRSKLYPTKLGPERAFQDDLGRWRMMDVDENSQPFTLRNVLLANLYVHIRPYLMGLALLETKDDTKWMPEVVILRDDDKVAVVKGGKLKLHSSDDWFKKNLKKKTGRES